MNIAYRIERDSLGEIEVPAAALYGVQTQRAVLNFPISGLRPWRAFIWSMATIKRAAAEVNRDLGLLDPERAQAIAPGSPGSDRRALGRPVCGRSIPGRGGHQPQHEHQRGHRQPGHPAPGRGAGRVPGQPQRPCQHGAVHQRHHPHRHPPGGAVAAGRAAGCPGRAG